MTMSGFVTLESELTITGAAWTPDILGEVCEWVQGPSTAGTGAVRRQETIL